MILDNGTHLAVKSMSVEQAKKYGASWTFQKGGKSGFTDPLLSNPNGFIAFVLVNRDEVELVAVKRAESIIPLLKDPVLDRLKDEKGCLYIEDLKEKE